MPKTKQQTVPTSGTDGWYTPEEVAQILKLPSAKTVQEYCRNGDVFQPGIEAIQVGRYWRIDLGAARSRWAEEQSQPRQV